MSLFPELSFDLCVNIEELLTERYDGLCCSSMGQMLGITPTHVSNRAPFKKVYIFEGINSVMSHLRKR